MPAKNKGKGKNKNKPKGGGGKNKGGKGGGGGGKGKKQGGGGGGKQQSRSPSKSSKGNKSDEKQQEQQRQQLETKSLSQIDAMYANFAQKHAHMRTFFGIFTRHNQLLLRDLMAASIPDINAQLSDKYIRSTQNEDNRSLNQFIFLGDVAIGVYCTELQYNQKEALVRAFCILPAFRNFGFGSRLLVHLIKNGVKRRKLNTISVFVSEANEKGMAFFARFGFEAQKQQTKNAKEEKKDEEEPNGGAAEAKRIKMRLDLRLFRQSVLVLVKKQIKAEAASAKNTSKQTTD